MPTRTFPLRTVLTVTTDYLLTKPRGENDNGIGDLYEILKHLTGESPYTHALPRFMNECRPWLLRWYPELERANEHLKPESGRHNLDDLLAAAEGSRLEAEVAVCHWLDMCRDVWGMRAEYEIGQIPVDDHDVKNLHDELVQMRGTDEGIIIVGHSE